MPTLKICLCSHCSASLPFSLAFATTSALSCDRCCVTNSLSSNSIRLFIYISSAQLYLRMSFTSASSSFLSLSKNSKVVSCSIGGISGLKIISLRSHLINPQREGYKPGLSKEHLRYVIRFNPQREGYKQRTTN